MRESGERDWQREGFGGRERERERGGGGGENEKSKSEKKKTTEMPKDLL